MAMTTDRKNEILAYLDKCRPVRRSKSGSRQWAAVGPSGETVQFPAMFDHETLGKVATHILFFRRKMDVTEAIARVRAEIGGV